MTAMQGKLVVEVNDFDVFFGRGKNAFNRPGNVNFRLLAKEKSCIFYGASGAQTNTKTKTELARDMMAEIDERGGRFLRPVTASNVHGSVCSAWEVVTGEVALIKTKQAMRDAWSKSKPKKADTLKRRSLDQQHAPTFERQAFSAIPSYSQASLGFLPPSQLQLFQHGLLNPPCTPLGPPYGNSLQNLWLGGMVQGTPPNQHLFTAGGLMMASQLGNQPTGNFVPALVARNSSPGALPASAGQNIDTQTQDTPGSQQ